jgi:uncharacterized membrane protein
MAEHSNSEESLSDSNPQQTEVTIQRMGRGGYLHSIIPILDKSGRVIQRIAKPLMVEVRARDLLQIIVGAAMLAVPVGFTEETWNLGSNLPIFNVIALGSISLLFISIFVYLNFYRFYLNQFVFEYIKRVLIIYIMSIIVVAILLTIIEQCPWETDYILAIKRVIIVTFPASMSATLMDTIM